MNDEEHILTNVVDLDRHREERLKKLQKEQDWAWLEKFFGDPTDPELSSGPEYSDGLNHIRRTES